MEYVLFALLALNLLLMVPAAPTVESTNRFQMENASAIKDLHLTQPKCALLVKIFPMVSSLMVIVQSALGV